jgi:hypothetical protein
MGSPIPSVGKGLKCFLSQQKPFREVLLVQANPSENTGFEVRKREIRKDYQRERQSKLNDGSPFYRERGT